MADIKLLKRELKVLTFDQYGTVVDMQGGLTKIATPYLEEKGWKGEPSRFVTWWRRTHFENSMIDALCDRGHTPYREIGHRAVSFTLDRAGIQHTSAEVEMLVSEIEKLTPFPEVPDALKRLAKQYRLVILSNGDRDMLEAAKPYLGHKFDQTIYTEEALHRLVEIHYIIGLENESQKYAKLLGYNYQSSQWYEKSYAIFDKMYEKSKKDNEIKKRKQNSLLKKFKSLF